MNKKTAVAIATGIAILMVAGVLLFVFQPQKQVSHRPPQRITDDAPRITEFVGVGLMLRNDTGDTQSLFNKSFPIPRRRRRTSAVA